VKEPKQREDTSQFWMDTIFVAFGLIALFAVVVLGLAILMQQ
jgi:hypothetical protein